MRYFTKEWFDDIRTQRSEEFYELLGGLLDQGHSLSQAHIKMGEHVDTQRSMGIYSPEQVKWDYQRYYDSIRPHLTEAIRNISDSNLLHDHGISETPILNDGNLHLKFLITAIDSMCRGREWFSSIDFSGFEGEFFMLSRLVFINAKVVKNELTFDANESAYCMTSEVHLHPDGYEMHILASKLEWGAQNNSLAELIVVFEDVIIEVEEVSTSNTYLE